MSGYKLVPVEPTAEMVEAAQDAYMPFGDMNTAIMMAVLAAPAVQGEPVAYQYRIKTTTTGSKWSGWVECSREEYEYAAENPGPCGSGITREGRKLYAAPQPTISDEIQARTTFGGPQRFTTAEHQTAPNAPAPTFHLGDTVRKTKGSQWKGRVVGTYSTSLTPEGYAVESDTEKGSVQIYPVGALELVGGDA